MAAVARLVGACEDACRKLAASCMTAAQAVNGWLYTDVEKYANHLMDCSYIASATARVLSRFERHDLDMVVFQVEVCQRAADLCAASCGGTRSTERLETCGTLSRECADACAALLRALGVHPVLKVGGPVPPGDDSRDEGNGAAA